jgi:hypothetical protein
MELSRSAIMFGVPLCETERILGKGYPRLKPPAVSRLSQVTGKDCARVAIFTARSLRPGRRRRPNRGKFISRKLFSSQLLEFGAGAQELGLRGFAL